MVFQWLSASEGPLVLTGRNARSDWSAEHLALARQYPDPLASVEVVSPRDALILEGGFATTWWPTPEIGGGIIVRKLWAEDDESILKALRSVPAAAWFENGLTVEISAAAQILFDGSLMNTQDDLELFIPRCQYALESANVEPDPSTCLVLHRLSCVH